MTAVRVVDTSALAALLFDEPEAEHVVDRLEDGVLVAPTLLGCELANVCLIKMRQHPEQGEALLRAYAYRRRLSIEEVEVDFDATVDLASRTGLTAYDASYLWLARKLNAELVTLDEQLANAASARW